MAIQDIRFDPNGPSIRAAVVFRTPQVVSYGLMLWESGSNDVVMEEKGNSENPEDDAYSLPMPARDNNGRILECDLVIVSPDPKPSEKYQVDLVVSQGASELGKLSAMGTVSAKTSTDTLFAKLVGA